MSHMLAFPQHYGGVWGTSLAAIPVLMLVGDYMAANEDILFRLGCFHLTPYVLCLTLPFFARASITARISYLFGSIFTVLATLFGGNYLFPLGDFSVNTTDFY